MFLGMVHHAAHDPVGGAATTFYIEGILLHILQVPHKLFMGIRFYDALQGFQFRRNLVGQLGRIQGKVVDKIQRVFNLMGYPGCEPAPGRLVFPAQPVDPCCA